MGSGRPVSPSSPPRNAGSLAHLAVQRWVESESWRDDDDASTLVRLFREEAERHGMSIELLPDGRTTEARLEVQGPALINVLKDFTGGSAGSVQAEVALYDTDAQLWGTIDLLLKSGSESAVIDLKTGADAAGSELPDSISNQLRHYALLVWAELGTPPKMLSLFSLRRGLRPISFDSEDLVELRSRLDSARKEWILGVRSAHPSPEVCRFCYRRLYCDPHWAEVAGWDKVDAVNGVLERIDIATNGLAAIVLRTDSCQVWISGIPSSSVTSLKIGEATRAVRVRRVEQEEDSDEPARWFATEHSAFANV
jgi:hypothetical protein